MNNFYNIFVPRINDFDADFRIISFIFASTTFLLKLNHSPEERGLNEEEFGRPKKTFRSDSAWRKKVTSFFRLALKPCYAFLPFELFPNQSTSDRPSAIPFWRPLSGGWHRTLHRTRRLTIFVQGLWRLGVRVKLKYKTSFVSTLHLSRNIVSIGW